MNLLKSYLTNRFQFSSCRSNSRLTCSGVPQGSILGPLLFIIFINDLPLAGGGVGSFYIYADDTAVVVSGPKVREVIKRLQDLLDKIVLWFSNNLLQLNDDKCAFIIFCSSWKYSEIKEQLSSLSVIINGSILEPTESIKYLDMIFDRSFRWTEQMFVRNKLSTYMM